MSGNHADINITYALEKFGAIWGGIPGCQDNCRWLGKLRATVSRYLPSSLVVGSYAQGRGRVSKGRRGHDVPLCRCDTSLR